jgi:hypothetical protein
MLLGLGTPLTVVAISRLRPPNTGLPRLGRPEASLGLWRYLGVTYGMGLRLQIIAN